MLNEYKVLTPAELDGHLCTQIYNYSYLLCECDAETEQLPVASRAKYNIDNMQ